MLIQPIHKKIAIGAGIAVVCAIAAAGAWIFWPTASRDEKLAAEVPVPTTQNAPEVIATISQISFDKLSDQQRKDLMDKMRNAPPEARAAMFEQSRNLSDDERRQFRSNMRSGFREMMHQRVDEFSKLQSKEEKDAYLDKMIDEMQERRKQRDQGQASRDNRGGGPDRRNMSDADRAKRRKERIDTTSPQDRAKFMAFRAAMAKRMQERGITPPSRGGH